MIETGQARRDRLIEVAEKFYKLHARSVDVVGSNKHERFDVTRLNNDSTEVVVFKMTREGEIREEIYRRVIHRGETKEIVLYGLGGNDQFVFSGRVAGGIKVYAVGGTGVDTYIDESTGGRIVIHDSHGENDIRPGQSTSVELSDDPERHQYTRSFEFPHTYPIALAFYTTDAARCRTARGVGHAGLQSRKLDIAAAIERESGKLNFADLLRWGGRRWCLVRSLFGNWLLSSGARIFVFACRRILRARWAGRLLAPQLTAAPQKEDQQNDRRCFSYHSLFSMPSLQRKSQHELDSLRPAYCAHLANRS